MDGARIFESSQTEDRRNTNLLTIFVCMFVMNQDRPSTKVKSAPGGDSSLGYLFGDK